MSRSQEQEVRPRVALDGSLRGRVRAAVVWIDGVTPETGGAAYEALMECARGYRERWKGKTVGQVEGVKAARRLYRLFQVDPTSTRPSSEALLKRALDGRELYRLNTLVDTGNLVSLETLLPLGLYDRDRIVADEVVIREGRPGEEYPGIRKGPVHLQGRLCIADGEGPFGSPTSDSHRTRITDATRRVLVVLFAPSDIEAGRLEEAGRRAAETFARYAGGTVQQESILEPAG